MTHIFFYIMAMAKFVFRLPAEEMASGCTMGKKQSSKGSVMPWAMFFSETLGPGILMDVTLT